MGVRVWPRTAVTVTTLICLFIVALKTYLVVHLPLTACAIYHFGMQVPAHNLYQMVNRSSCKTAVVHFVVIKPRA